MRWRNWVILRRGFLSPRRVIEPLGGPFLIMERMPGRPLGSEFEGLSIKGLGQTLNLVWQVPRIRREILRLWGEAQTRLHAVPAGEFVERVERAGIPGESLTFDSEFGRQRAFVQELDLKDLRPVVDWLMTNRPQAQTAVVCHGDFQPTNVLADNGRLTGVIDWVKATIAEPAFDYGAMIAILATVPIRVLGRSKSGDACRDEQPGAHPFAWLSIDAGRRGRSQVLPGFQLPGAAGYGRQKSRAGKQDAGRL